MDICFNGTLILDFFFCRADLLLKCIFCYSFPYFTRFVLKGLPFVMLKSALHYLFLLKSFEGEFTILEEGFASWKNGEEKRLIYNFLLDGKDH